MQRVSEEDFQRRFTYLRELDSGYFGRTSIVKEVETAALFVVKHFDLSKLGSRESLQEIIESYQTVASLEYDFLVKAVFYVEFADGVAVLRPYVEGSFLSHFRLSPSSGDIDNIMFIWRGIVRCYVNLQSAGVSPSFIKPSNIVITPMRSVLLTDVYKIPTRVATVIVNPEPRKILFLAPELFSDDAPRTPRSDIWSLGAVLLFMVRSFLPWETRNVFATVKMITRGEIQYDKMLPLEVRDLLGSTMLRDPAQRMTLQQLLRIRARSTGADTFRFIERKAGTYVAGERRRSGTLLRTGRNVITKSRTEREKNLPPLPPGLISEFLQATGGTRQRSARGSADEL